MRILVLYLFFSASCFAAVINSFNVGYFPGGVAYDSSTESVYILPLYNTSGMYQYDKNGNQLNFSSATAPGGVGGSEWDWDLVSSSFTMDGTNIPAGSLLFANGNNNRLYAMDTNFNVLKDVSIAGNSNASGVAYHAQRDTFFTLEWPTGQVHEHSLDGAVINTFSVSGASGAPGGFSGNLNMSDIEVNAANGHLYIVSDSTGAIRELTADGVWVQDIDVTPFGIAGGFAGNSMTGIAFDNTTGHAWISTRNGTVLELSSLAPASTSIPEPSSYILGLLALSLITLKKRK